MAMTGHKVRLLSIVIESSLIFSLAMPTERETANTADGANDETLSQT